LRNNPNGMKAARDLWNAVLREITNRSPGFDVSNAWFLVVDKGLGDVVHVLSLLPTFRERHGGPIVIIAPESKSGIVGLFRDHFDGSIFVPEEATRAFADLPKIGGFQRGLPYYTWWPAHGEAQLGKPFIEWEDGLTVKQLTAIMLRLPPNAPSVAPLVSEASRNEAHATFDRLGVRAGHTVVMFPWSNSARNLPETWWEEFHQAVRARGLHAVVNATAASSSHFGRLSRRDGNLELGIDGTANLTDLPIDQVIPFVERAGYLATVASGICDVLARSDARKLVLYSYERTPGGSLEDDLLRANGGKVGGGSIVRSYDAQDCVEIDIALDEAFDASKIERWFLSRQERDRLALWERLAELDREREKLMLELNN